MFLLLMLMLFGFEYWLWKRLFGVCRIVLVFLFCMVFFEDLVEGCGFYYEKRKSIYIVILVFIVFNIIW